MSIEEYRAGIDQRPAKRPSIGQAIRDGDFYSIPLFCESPSCKERPQYIRHDNDIPDYFCRDCAEDWLRDAHE